jgi:hypothetical protein
VPGFRRLCGLAPLLLLLSVHPVRSTPPASAPKKVDTAEIDRLIAQLGSDKFKERQAATKRLAEIGYPALSALRRAIADNKDLQIRRRAELLVQDLENTLEALADDYKAYGLPLFPEHARPVRYKRSPEDQYSLGLLIDSPVPFVPPFLLHGTSLDNMTDLSWDIVPVAPENLSAAALRQLVEGADLWRDEALAVAIQYRAAGHDRLARALFASAVRKTADQSPKGELAGFAWIHWEIQHTETDTDLRLIVRHMRTILAAEQMQGEKEKNRELLRSLELSLKPSRAIPGSDEALIDELVNVRNEHLQFVLDRAIDSAYLRLLDRGFQAVPALIEHMDDERLTRRLVWGGIQVGGAGGPTRDRVGDLARTLLRALALDDFWEERPDTPEARREAKAKARAAFEKVKKIGEDVYFLQYVLPEKADFPNDHMLRIFSKRYPRRLPEIYRRLLAERPGMQSWPVVEAIRLSSLPRGKQQELFLAGARHKDLEHRRYALWELKDLDQRQFTECLLATLEALPRTPSRLSSHCPEALLPALVTETDDPRLWKALEKATKRAEAGLRMEILKEVCRPSRRGLAFLAAFLNDNTVREIKEKSDSFGASPTASNFPRLEVRNFAARELAVLLKIDANPRPDWSPEQWAELRNRVRKALP